MFLDPEPKQRRQSGSGFFSSQRPVVSPRDRASATWRRKHTPLEERSDSDNNQQNVGTSPQKSTVRLVKPSPESPSSNGSDADEEDSADGKENIAVRQNLEHLPSSPTDIIEASAIKPGSSGSSASDQGFHVSDAHKPANEQRTPTRFGHDNLLSSTSGVVISRPEWHRRSGSSGRYSYTSTLRESESGHERQSISTGGRISDISTVRTTPTESEIHERLKEDESSRQTSGQRLSTLEEASPERSTVRVIATPSASPSSEDRSPAVRVNLSGTRPRTSPSESDPDATPSQRSSRRTSSAGSLPALNSLRALPASPTPRHQRSEESIARSDSTIPGISSPNLVAFGSESSRPRSYSQPLHPATSVESIQSRLQNSTALRPTSEQSSSPWSSRPPTSDTLPPLQSPRKRARQLPRAPSINTAGNSASASGMEDDADFDTQPYPRHTFSMHLSTIASESDPHSRTTSQQLSHFSLGSGVWTGDDSGSIPNSATWPRQDQESGFDDYPSRQVSPIVPAMTSEEEQGEIPTRVSGVSALSGEDGAAPPAMSQMRSPSAPISVKKYEGALRPLPPIPKSGDSDEDFDTVPELGYLQLRAQRSGYSLRRRSDSTPERHSHSRQVSQASDSTRWSQGTNIFPTWAKAYYAYGATLLSSSQISLSTPLEPSRSQNLYPYRFNREWGAASISTSFGTSDNTGDSVSPASSRFLPSIFRPRAWRERSTSAKKWKLKSPKTSPKPSPQPVDSRPDSMAITRDPLPTNSPDVLPSGQPKYGELKEECGQHRPLPRTYSKHKKWDEMQFPRPMSKDALSGYPNDPRLGPSKRSKNGISTWRAPSFVESLDTLVRSRCNRQILFFALGFIFPPFWMLASVLPLPEKPMSASEFEKVKAMGGSEEDIQTAMMKHEAGDAEKRWREERTWLKARWWRYLNRIMSVIGVLVIGAVIALAIVATTK